MIFSFKGNINIIQVIRDMDPLTRIYIYVWDDMTKLFKHRGHGLMCVSQEKIKNISF